MNTTAQARVIDPVLTHHAQGYKNAKFVGHTLFPAVNVNARGGTVIEFGKEAFLKYNARRAPGASVSQVDFGHEGKPFALVQDSLDGLIPREHMEDAQAVPNIDLGMRAVSRVMRILQLGLEIEQAELALDDTLYGANNQLVLDGSAGKEKWTDPVSNPEKMIDAAKNAVRGSSGVEPNRMIIGPDVFTAWKTLPSIKDQFKYTSSESITAKMLANLFDLDDLAVGKATVFNEATNQFDDVWDGAAVLAYAPMSPDGYEEPSYGYTYTLQKHPLVDAPFWKHEKRSWLYGVTYERKPVHTGIASGFLFKDVV